MKDYSTITTKYQVTIPKYIRSHFSDLVPFSKVKFTYNKEDNSFTIKPVKRLEDYIGILPNPKRNPASLKIKNNIRIDYYEKKFSNS